MSHGVDELRSRGVEEQATAEPSRSSRPSVASLVDRDPFEVAHELTLKLIRAEVRKELGPTATAEMIDQEASRRYLKEARDIAEREEYEAHCEELQQALQSGEPVTVMPGQFVLPERALSYAIAPRPSALATQPYIEEPSVWCDMHGTLVDFCGAVFELFGKTYDPRQWPEGVYALETALPATTEDLWRQINRGGEGWWAELDYLDHAEELIDGLLWGGKRLVEPERFHIISKPSHDWTSWSGKAQWVWEFLTTHRAQLLEPIDHLHLTRKKYTQARPGRILIDDNEEEIRAWTERGGQAVLCPAPWNSLREVFFSGNVAQFVLQQVEHELALLNSN